MTSLAATTSYVSHFFWQYWVNVKTSGRLFLNKHLKNNSGDSSWKSHNPIDISTHAQGYILGHTFWVQLDYRAVNIYRYPQRSSTWQAVETEQDLTGIWQYGLSSFQAGDTKLERFLAKNQHTQRILLNFKNWCNGHLSKIGHHFRPMLIFRQKSF